MNFVSAGWSSSRGRRPYNEDRCTIAVPLSEDCVLAAVYDGHNGSEVAEYLARNFYQLIRKELQRNRGIFHRLWSGLWIHVGSFFTNLVGCVTNPNASRIIDPQEEPLTQILSQSFDRMDKQVLKHVRKIGDNSGSTAAVVLVNQTVIAAANVGDARTILWRGAENGVVELSRDHKPNDLHEYELIMNRGGTVMQSYVVSSTMEGLAVSRAFGDVTFRTEPNNVITATPDVFSCTRSAEDRFVIVASDGLFDVFGNEEACRMVEEYLRGSDEVQGDWKTLEDETVDDWESSRPSFSNSCYQVDGLSMLCQDAARHLVESALKAGSSDNVTVALVVFESACCERQ